MKLSPEQIAAYEAVSRPLIEAQDALLEAQRVYNERGVHLVSARLRLEEETEGAFDALTDSVTQAGEIVKDGAGAGVRSVVARITGRRIVQRGQ